MTTAVEIQLRSTDDTWVSAGWQAFDVVPAKGDMVVMEGTVAERWEVVARTWVDKVVPFTGTMRDAGLANRRLWTCQLWLEY